MLCAKIPWVFFVKAGEINLKGVQIIITDSRFQACPPEEGFQSFLLKKGFQGHQATLWLGLAGCHR